MLNIPSETIEDWARVLEEEGILRIEYRLTKIYLLWVKPTEEEIASERKSFYEEKTRSPRKWSRSRARSQTDIADVGESAEDVRGFLSKAYPKIDALEKKVANLPGGRHHRERRAGQVRGRAQGDGIQAQRDRGRLGPDEERGRRILGVSGGKGPSEELLERLDKMGQELGSYKKEMEDLRRKAGRDEAQGRRSRCRAPGR